ncbi:MAG: tRNA 2-thiouridine(34) synthase MnmA [Clostridia bacterium]
MEKKKIAVAMSGGVDSSVAAAILLKEGHEICGITMIISSDEKGNPDDKAAEDAKYICNQLGIKHYAVDLRDEFHKKVIKPFADEYSSGKTPNPCVICNERIKFGALIDYAQSLGFPYFATGHYLNLEYDDSTQTYKILQAKDEEKDQAYMLYRLNQEVLSKLVFPLSDYTKDEVYEIAKKYGLKSADSQESQDICFVPDMQSYSSYLEDKNLIRHKEGYFIDTDGNKIKRHEGVYNYTIGQRRGLGIALGYPAYVVKINYDTGDIIVGDKTNLYSNEMVVSNVNWISKKYIPGDNLEVKVRYSTYKHKAIIKEKDKDNYIISFYDNVRAITPGQSAVFYKGKELIGGGFIKEVL